MYQLPEVGNTEVWVYNIIGSYEPGVPVLQLTSYTEDSLTRFQWILGTALQKKKLKNRRKVTSVRKKKRKKRKGSKIKKFKKIRRPSVKGDFGSCCSGRNPKSKEKEE